MYNIYMYTCVCAMYMHMHINYLFLSIRCPSSLLLTFPEVIQREWYGPWVRRKHWCPKPQRLAVHLAPKSIVQYMCIYIYSSTETTILNLSPELQNIRHL